MPESKITAERIREIYDYNPETGEFIRRIYSKGYVDNTIISHDLDVDGEKHELSRFIWLHYYGVWPSWNMVVDHRNRIRSDNKLTNLRLATYGQNNINKECQNQYGCKGIEFRNRRRCWVVRVWYEGKRTYIGSYEEFDEAKAAYEEAALRIQGEFACLT